MQTQIRSCKMGFLIKIYTITNPANFRSVVGVEVSHYLEYLQQHYIFIFVANENKPSLNF